MDNRALRRGNALLAFVHAAQAVVILALSTDFSLPVTGAFMEASREAVSRSRSCCSTSASARSSAHSCSSQRSTTLSSRAAVPRTLRTVPRRRPTRSAGSSTRCRRR